MGTRLKLAASVLTVGAIGAAALFGAGVGQPVHAQSSKPNIIFIILDDVGIDQLTIFGNGGVLPPLTPNIDLIAARGVKFTNAWAMPECSPSRAAFFTGRYPVRTGVEAAIVNNHLPQSYVSSFEATLPRVLAKAGYTSALIGKYHLGSEQDPAQLCAPSTRGFPVFQGGMAAGPPSVDATAGGVDPTASQACGYYQTTAAGACYTTPGDAVRCAVIDTSNADPGTDPARTCLQRGGIFVPNMACRVNEPSFSDFSRTNGYYVWARTSLSGVLDPSYVDVNHVCGTTIDRTYLTKAQGNDGVNWWQQQSGPRMLTLSFNTMHTPVQKPPTDLVPDPLDAASTCSNATPPRPLLNMMIEGADVQIGRTLAQLGLGTLAPNGSTLTSLNLDNTVVVIIGDNGSQGQAVRAPFNPVRAKTTVYQTGVWVPLIVAGSVVTLPGRSVDAMVNAVDLYKLFGDLAGIDIASVVPPSHALDSQPMLPYLTNPVATEIRTTNFSQEGVATYSPVPSERSYPCQIGNACNDTLFGDQAFCEVDNGGTWYGPGGAKQLTSCCAVQSYLGTTLSLAPVHQYAVRNKRFKLVSLQRLDCSQPITNASQPKPFPWAEYLTTTTQEFYDLLLDPNGLDNAAGNLAQNCAPGQDLTTCLPAQLDVTNYQSLNAELQATLYSANAQNICQAKGDGNMDMRVTQADIQGWQAFNGKGPSRYDINLDGQTDEKDIAIIQANLGQDCLNVCVRADLNRDGTVDSVDLGLLYTQTGVCTDPIFCSGDLDGDGNVNNSDVTIMTSVQSLCQNYNGGVGYSPGIFMNDAHVVPPSPVPGSQPMLPSVSNTAATTTTTPSKTDSQGLITGFETTSNSVDANICVRADLNHDGKIDSADLGVLYTQTGVCNGPVSCSGDLDGNGMINDSDVEILMSALKTCN